MHRTVTIKRIIGFSVILLVVAYLASPALRMSIFLYRYAEEDAFIFYIGEGSNGGVDCPIETCPECKKILRELLDSLSGCSYSTERPTEWMYRICIQNDADGNWINATIIGNDVYFSETDSFGVYKSNKAVAFQQAVKKVLEFEVNGVKVDIRSPTPRP